MGTCSCHSLGFCTGKRPVESVGLSAARKAQRSRKLWQDWDIMYFRIFIRHTVSLKACLQAENGPLHIQNISKIRSLIQHKSFLVYIVRRREEKSLAFLAACSINCPGNPISGKGLFSTSVWALFCVFLWHVCLVFCFVDLYIRDSIPTFQNHLSSTFPPKTPSPTEVWRLFTTVTPCNCRHHSRVPSQVITYSPSSGSAVWGPSPSRKWKKGRNQASKEIKKERGRKANRDNIALCSISLATTSTINAFEEKVEVSPFLQLEIPFASSTSPGSHFARLRPTAYPGATPTALDQGWVSRSREHL